MQRKLRYPTFAIFAGHILIFAVQMSGHTLCHEDGRKVGSQATALHGCSKLRGNSHVLVAGTGAMGISHCPSFHKGSGTVTICIL
jgi:hypothetical protein